MLRGLFGRLGEGGARDRFDRVGRLVTARPVATVAVVAALAVVALALALRLEPSSSTDTLVGRDSKTFQATERYRKQFGGDSVLVLVRGNLQQTVLTSDLSPLIGLEGCLSGNVPEPKLRELPPVCTRLAHTKPAKVVYGPGTFIETAVEQIQQGIQTQQASAAAQGQRAADAAREIARRQGAPKARQEQVASEARQLAYSTFLKQAITLALRYNLTSLPSINNPSFVSQLVFDASKGLGVPKARFAYLFPSKRSALIQVRLKPGLSDKQRREAIDNVRTAVRAKRFKLDHGQQYVVTGIPVVVDALAGAVQRSIFVLLGVALLVMAATLAIVFRTRMRLLPLGTALVAAALTYGAVSLAGFDLTMASIAALPVLIGLAVDYAIQLQARFDEARGEGRAPVSAARAAAVRGGPLVAGAGLATAAGFLVLLLSPVPMIHGFAITVILGIALAFACAVTAGLATLSHWSQREPAAPDVPPIMPRLRAFLVRTWDRVAWSRLGRDVAAAAAEVADRARDAGRAALGFALRHPRNVLVAGLALAALGWAADTQTKVVSDVRQLVPQDLPALRDVDTLQKDTGVSGEIDVVIRGADLTRPDVVNWMTGFQSRILSQHGYSPGKTCQQPKNAPELCPALSLTDLFRSNTGQQVDARTLLAAVPRYFSQAVISSDRKIANLAFGIRLMPLDRQKQVIDDIRSQLHPPAGVDAEVAGVPVLAAESNGKLASPWRRALTLLAGLAAVFLVLYAIRRRLSAALVPLIPIAFATGWSALVLFVTGIPLNPMSATLGALVIAISTEFSVLLSARYREERAGGQSPRDAIEATYRSTGAAVLASGATAIAGFGTLMVSDIEMLQDFGVVTVVDLTVSLLGVMVVLPAALVWAEGRDRLELADLSPRRGLRALRDYLGDAVGGLRWRPRRSGA